VERQTSKRRAGPLRGGGGLWAVAVRGHATRPTAWEWSRNSEAHNRGDRLGVRRREDGFGGYTATNWTAFRALWGNFSDWSTERLYSLLKNGTCQRNIATLIVSLISAFAFGVHPLWELFRFAQSCVGCFCRSTPPSESHMISHTQPHAKIRLFPGPVT
jgi:hypothetical protein